jgi:hypothetical protein
MSIETVRTQLATLQASISGVKRAFEQLPRGAIVDADLPLFLNFARNAIYDWSILGADTNQSTRIYLMRLLVMPQQSGIDGEGESAVEPFIKTVVDYFASRPQLGRLSGVQNAIIVGDSGPQQFVWFDIPYWSVEFQLRVVEYATRDYQNYE